MSEVISRITIDITYIGGLITPFLTSHVQYMVSGQTSLKNGSTQRSEKDNHDDRQNLTS